MSFEAEGGQIEEPQGAAPEAGAEGAPQAEQPPAAPDPVTERFDALERAFTRSFEQLAQRLPEPAAPPAEPEAPEFTADDLLRELGDENFTDEGVLTAEGLVALARETAQRELESRDRRAEAQRAAERREQGLLALEQRYPALRDDPQVQAQVIQRVTNLAQSIAAGTGADPQLVAQDPTLVEQVYLSIAGAGSGTGGGEPPAQPSNPEVPVERPGGASVAQTPQKDRGDRLVELAQAGYSLS
jgi:hypothetical protein